MNGMIVRRRNGENGDNFILERYNTKLSIESINSYENTSVKVSFFDILDDNCRFSIYQSDSVYDAFETFYYDQKLVRAQYGTDPLFGIKMKRVEQGYVLKFNSPNEIIDIANPNFAWTNLYNNLQNVPSNEDVDYYVKDKGYARERIK